MSGLDGLARYSRDQVSEGSRLTTDEAIILYRDAPLHELRIAANLRRVKINGDRSHVSHRS